MIKVTEDHYEIARNQDQINETKEDGLFVLKNKRSIGGVKADVWHVDLRNGTFDFYGYYDGEPVKPPRTPKPVKELKSHIMAEGSKDLNQFV